MGERFSYSGYLPFNHVFKKIYPLLIHDADYIKNVPKFKVKLFFSLSFKCSIFIHVFKKGFTPALKGRFTLPILSQIMNIQGI